MEGQKVNAFWREVDKALAARGERRPWLAAQTGISLGRINNWYVRGTSPRVEDAVTIAQALKITVHQLVTGKQLLTVESLPNHIGHLVEQFLDMEENDRERLLAVCKAVMALMEQGVLDMPLNAYLRMVRQTKVKPSGSLQPSEKDRGGYTSE